MKNRKNRKGGFSIVEAVIALAIVTLMVMVAPTVAKLTITTRATLATRTEAINFAENALECFKAAKDVREFNLLLIDAEIIKPAEGGLSIENNEPYPHDGGKFNATITVDYPTDPTDLTKRPKFNIVVTDNNNAEIISLEYIKGAK